MSSFSCRHIDTCLSSFLLDHHNRDGELLLGVAVDGASTVGNVLDDLEAELREVILEEGERGGFTYEGARQALADQRNENLDRLDRLFDSSLEVLSDDDFNMEHCSAWFLLTWDETEEPGE